MVMVERSDRMWPAEEDNGKPLLYSCLEVTILVSKTTMKYLKKAVVLLSTKLDYTHIYTLLNIPSEAQYFPRIQVKNP